MDPLIFVTYDGIENSVFQSQVLTPLIRISAHRPVHLVSFERGTPTTESSLNVPVTVHVLKRFPFLGRLSMWHSTLLLKKRLRTFPRYELVARGPLAGYICLCALNQNCSNLTIQARGLLAEEYAYAHSSYATPLHRLWHWWREQSLQFIERNVYGKNVFAVPTVIEAVSVGLKEHLATTYGTLESLIRIARNDIPMPIDASKKAVWRQEVRQELGIPSDSPVYCYNGSAKAWQCPDMTVAFFRQALEKNPRSFLLVITQDKKPFLTLLQQMLIPTHNFYVVTVHHADVYRYLSACDTGIIFRKASVINWVSRPTKALEYQALGLHIAHNNTVKMLCR